MGNKYKGRGRATKGITSGLITINFTYTTFITLALK